MKFQNEIEFYSLLLILNTSEQRLKLESPRYLEAFLKTDEGNNFEIYL